MADSRQEQIPTDRVIPGAYYDAAVAALARLKAIYAAAVGNEMHPLEAIGRMGVEADNARSALGRTL